MDNTVLQNKSDSKELKRNKNQQQQPHQPQRSEQQEITEQSPKQQLSKRNKLVRTTESLGNTFSAALKPTTTTITTTLSTSLNVVTTAIQCLKDGSTDVMGGGLPISPLTATSAIAVKHFKQQQKNYLEKAIVSIEATPTPIPKTTAIITKSKQINSVNEKANRPIQMKEKLLESFQTENVVEKSDKLSKINKNKEEEEISTIANSSSVNSKSKTVKESRGKFAEKLRRSFRRGEHKSLEIKRPDKSFEGLIEGSRSANHTTQRYSPEDINNTHFNFSPFGLRSLPPLQRTSHSIFSLTHLPGLSAGGVGSGSKSSIYSSTSGGHINPALLLDSPDVDTPPEYAYHHLSSVATTNSSTSLESNFGDFGDRTSSQSSISYWAWHQSNSSMGGEVSTNINADGFGLNGSTEKASNSNVNTNADGCVSENKNISGKSSKQNPPKLQSQSSSKSDTQHQQASRSCSITSESSSTKLTRLQNFLFKSSNESTRSFHAHSNEAFTASSHNSSSGEWENLGFTTTSGSGSHVPADFYVGSFPEETDDADGVFTADPPTDNKTSSSSRPILKRADSSEAAGSYYQYTLTSPNNPFLPEIIARTYHSAYEEDNEIFDNNVTAVKYGQSGETNAVGSDAGCGGAGGTGGTHSAQLPTPAYSRAGSQESTHSDSAIPAATFVSSSSPLPHTSSPASSSSSTPGRQRRKLFILNSPTRHLLHQQPSQKQQQQQITQAVTDGSTVYKSTPGASTSGSNFIKSLNPFLPIASSSNSSNNIVTTTTTQQGICHSSTLVASTTKRAPLKQSAVTSPIGVPQDLNVKREEFLRATMKICLVVSPPMSKLQLKSKSLTHLDGLDTLVACPHGVPTGKAPNTNANEANTTITKSAIGVQQQQQQQQLQQSAGVAVNASDGIVTTTTTDNSTTTESTIKKKSSNLQRKKPLLTRSEVSSSEYFSVSFCTDQGGQEEEFIPATKGVTLYCALSQALKRRNLSFSQIAITDSNPSNSFLEARCSPLASSLDENTDVENLAGHHLVVTECDGSRKTLQKAASFGSRTRPPRLLSSASTEETTEAAVPGKQLKQRWSGLFGIKNPQQNQLCELLNNYTKNGVPQKTASLNFDHPDFDAALEYLDNMHKSWNDIVDSNGMNDNDTRIQTAIWELVTTEVYYIHALQTVTDLFLACLEAVQEERLLIDVDQHRLFSNVRDICEANLKFWTLFLYPMVAHSVNTHEPLRITFFQQGFIAFASIFAPYKKYCAEQSTCQFYCKELNRNNALFTSYLAWCESQKMCNRLRLADILVRPMQRLTKYSLLLAAIKKHMSNVEQIETIDIMIHSVESFVFSVNNHLTTRQENERLKGVMARIESYDVVDTNNEHLDKIIKQYSQMFDLCSPMKGCPAHHVRHLFMEGDHKFKDNLGKADVHCFLLTDMLLVCKAIAKRGLGSLKVIRQPYLTDRLIVQQSNNILNCVYLNEFQVAITAFTLQCSEAKNWYESMKRAKIIYTRLKQGTGNWDNFRFCGNVAAATDTLSVKKSPINSSICSHVSSANNSHSGSVEWNDSRNISVEFEKTNSLSSDEGSMGKNLALASLKLKVNPVTANTLSVQPLNHLGQSLPNLNLNHSHNNLYYTYSNNTLLVPGTTTSHSGNVLLSPSHRGISYPPPSPTRVPLRRGMAFSTSIKNPPLVKSRNITSQNSINWPQLQTPPTLVNQHNLNSTPGNVTIMGRNATAAVSSPLSAMQQNQPKLQLDIENMTNVAPEITAIQMSSNSVIDSIGQQQQQQTQHLSSCNETDV